MIHPEGPIVKAAIRTPDGRVFTAWRHHDAIREATAAGATEHVRADDQGFVTENGRFLMRTQALAYAMHIGQITSIKGSVLTSEDLWDNEGNPITESKLDEWVPCTPKVEILGKQKTVVAPDLRLAFPRNKWSRGAAWDYLLKHPPTITIGKQVLKPRIEPKFNPYRKDHDGESWGWRVVSWESKDA